MRKGLLVGLAAAVLILGSAVTLYSFYLLKFASLATPRGTYAYWLCVAPLIQNVPEVDPAGPAGFFWSAGQGPVGRESEIRYESSAPGEAVVAAIERYLEQQGYQKDGLLYRREGSRVSLRLEPLDNGNRRVIVNETR